MEWPTVRKRAAIGCCFELDELTREYAFAGEFDSLAAHGVFSDVAAHRFEFGVMPGTQLHVAAERPGVNLNAILDENLRDPLSGNAVLSGIAVILAPLP